MTRDRQARIYAALLVVWLVVSAFLVGYTWPEDRPRCPSEDSCVVDYSDGEWHVVEVTP